MGLFRRRQKARPPLPDADNEEWVQILGDRKPTPVASMPPPHPGRPAVTLRRDGQPAETERAAVEPAAPSTAPVTAPAPVGTAPTTTTVELSPRVERALLALAAHAHQIEDRMRRLEERIEAAEHAPSHEDVMDVRMHSARVAAELARVTVQLKAEIDAARQPVRDDGPRIDALAEQVLALWDQIEALPVAVPPDDPAAEFARRRDDGTGPGLVAVV